MRLYDYKEKKKTKHKHRTFIAILNLPVIPPAARSWHNWSIINAKQKGKKKRGKAKD